jgi:DNA-binding SARP family transcriptional activator
VDFRVLGPIEVDVGATRLRLGNPQQRVVLAVLVIRANQVVSTDALVEAVWGDEAPNSAGNVVRTYISRLRQVLRVAGDSPLLGRRPGYVLEIDPDRVDAHRFEKLVRQALDARRAGRVDQTLATLRGALGLWRGEALADLAEWESLTPTIVRLEEMRLTAVEARIDAELELGRHSQVVAELETLARAHPFRERIWGQLIVALYRSNRQTAALAAYQAARTALVDQVGIEPGPELQGLERDVLAQSDRLLWRPSTMSEGPDLAGRFEQVPLQAALAGSGHDQPLVGRAHERTTLRSAFESLASREFGVLFVAGPPGIGKTALARVFAGEAHANGATVLFGRADEDSGSPFQALEEAIDHWVLHAEAEELESLGRSDAAHLARMVPRLAERRPELASVPISDTLASRRSVFRALMRWIEILAADRPAIIVLDDLHWADPATLDAIRHALRHPPAARAALLAISRDTEPDRTAELSAVVAGPDAGGRVRQLRLAGLADGDVLDLVQRHTGRQLGTGARRFAEQLNRRTGGNPLFVLEMLRDLVERGAIDGNDEHWPGSAASGGFGVPTRVTELIDQRLRRLPSSTAAALEPASVLGEQFDVAVLSRIVGMSEIDVLDALEPAVAAQLITSHDQRADRFSFAHGVVREAIFARLSLSHRSRLHWQAGRALVTVFARAPQRYLGEIARHLTAGVHTGEAGEAIAANVRAGQHGLSTLAFEEARDRFAAATVLLDRAGAIEPELAFDAWLGLGRAGLALADAQLQRTGHMQAAAIAWREHWSQRLAAAAVGVAANDLWWIPHPRSAPRRLDDPPTDGEVIREAQAASRGEPTVQSCLLLALQTGQAAVSKDRDEVQHMAQAATDAARQLDDPSATAAALTARCLSLLGTPRSTELRTAIEHALSLPLSAEAGVVRNLLLPVLVVPALQEGNQAELASVRSRVAAEPEGWGIHARSVMHSWDVAGALSRGQFDDAVQLIDSFPGAPDFVVWWLTAEAQRTIAALEQGRHDEQKTTLHQFLSASPELTAVRAQLALLHAELGDRCEATRHVEMVRRDQRLDQMAGYAPVTLRYLAELAARLDHRDLAHDLLPLLSDFAGQMLVSFGGVSIDGAADRAVGQVLLTLDRLDEAVDRLAAAEAFERSFGTDALATRTAYWHARALLRRDGSDDRPGARALLVRASSGARRLGMLQLLEDVNQLLEAPDQPLNGVD